MRRLACAWDPQTSTSSRTMSSDFEEDLHIAGSEVGCMLLVSSIPYDMVTHFFGQSYKEVIRMA